MVNKLIPCILCILILIIDQIIIISYQILIALLVICEIRFLICINKINWNQIWIIKRYVIEIIGIVKILLITCHTYCSPISWSKFVISYIWKIRSYVLLWTRTSIGTHHFLHHYKILVAISKSPSHLLSAWITNICSWNRVITCHISPNWTVWRQLHFYW